MKASVVINVHAGTRPDEFAEAADSVLAQDHDDLEFVVVVSAAPDLRREIEARYGDRPEVDVVTLDEDEGLSAARNAGASAATGDVVAFTDDDVVADPGWLSGLLAIYGAHDPAGVGGHVDPIWPADRPAVLPSEFDWLVGVMPENFVEHSEPQPVRNTYGCNISFDRETFLSAGGFRTDLGKNQDNPLQGEEAELCSRLDGEFWYAPDAVVRHRVDGGQLSVRYLLERSFWQGYSKAALAEELSDESAFLSTLFARSIPARLRRPMGRNLLEVLVLLAYTGAVGLGYVYGRVRSRAGVEPASPESDGLDDPETSELDGPDDPETT